MRGWWVWAVVFVCSGCNYAAYFVRDTPEPMRALEARMDPHERRSCLVVFMPGMLDTPDNFVDAGFLDAAASASDRCDLVAIDAHFGYYRSGRIRQRVTRDILLLAETRGYEDVWLVGISMGGLGALMVAQQNATRIRGVVLLAPFLGDEALVRSVADAGGLAEWDAPDDADPWDEDEFDDALWAWLRGYATAPEDMPELFVAVGTEDSLRPGIGVLAEALPAGHHGTAPGGHGWSTWRGLFAQLLESPPWDPRAAHAPGWG